MSRPAPDHMQLNFRVSKAFGAWLHTQAELHGRTTGKQLEFEVSRSYGGVPPWGDGSIAAAAEAHADSVGAVLHGRLPSVDPSSPLPSVDSSPKPEPLSSDPPASDIDVDIPLEDCSFARDPISGEQLYCEICGGAQRSTPSGATCSEHGGAEGLVWREFAAAFEKAWGVLPPPPARVVNLQREPYDVYIGRAGHGFDGYFGNPFTEAGGAGSREECLKRFKAYFLARVAADESFRQRVLGLRGLRLGCFCSPLPCHGDTIAAWIDAQGVAQGVAPLPAVATPQPLPLLPLLGAPDPMNTLSQQAQAAADGEALRPLDRACAATAPPVSFVAAPPPGLWAPGTLPSSPCGTGSALPESGVAALPPVGDGAQFATGSDGPPAPVFSQSVSKRIAALSAGDAHVKGAIKRFGKERWEASTPEEKLQLRELAKRFAFLERYGAMAGKSPASIAKLIGCDTAAAMQAIATSPLIAALSERLSYFKTAEAAGKLDEQKKAAREPRLRDKLPPPAPPHPIAHPPRVQGTSSDMIDAAASAAPPSVPQGEGEPGFETLPHRVEPKSGVRMLCVTCRDELKVFSEQRVSKKGATCVRGHLDAPGAPVMTWAETKMTREQFEAGLPLAMAAHAARSGAVGAVQEPPRNGDEAQEPVPPPAPAAPPALGSTLTLPGPHPRGFPFALELTPVGVNLTGPDGVVQALMPATHPGQLQTAGGLMYWTREALWALAPGAQLLLHPPQMTPAQAADPAHAGALSRVELLGVDTATGYVVVRSGDPAAQAAPFVVHVTRLRLAGSKGETP